MVMTGPSPVDVLQSQVVLFKSFLLTDEFCRIFASLSRETRVGNLAEFREAERAFDNLLELQAWDAYWRNVTDESVRNRVLRMRKDELVILWTNQISLVIFWAKRILRMWHVGVLSY